MDPDTLPAMQSFSTDELQAQRTRYLGQATESADYASHFLTVAFDTDPAMDQLSKVERAAIAAAHAQVAQAMALLTIARSQDILDEEIQQLNAAVRYIANNMPMAPMPGQ